VTIQVTSHAVDRARERRHYGQLARHELARMIELEIALAISAGRVATAKPAWTRLITKQEMHTGLNGKTLALKPGEQFVWNTDETLGWVVKRERGTTIVVTSLHRVRSVEACAA
jgi:hypothetical protein